MYAACFFPAFQAGYLYIPRGGTLFAMAASSILFFLYLSNIMGNVAFLGDPKMTKIFENFVFDNTPKKWFTFLKQMLFKTFTVKGGTESKGVFPVIVHIMNAEEASHTFKIVSKQILERQNSPKLVHFTPWSSITHSKVWKITVSVPCCCMQ